MDERSDHPGFEQLADYSDRQLQPLAVLQVSNHLAGCGPCQADVSWLEEIKAAIAADLWQEPSREARMQARQLFRLALASSRARGAARQRFGFGATGWRTPWQQVVDWLGGSRSQSALRPALAVAFAVVILIISIYSVRQWQRPGPPAPVVASLIQGEVGIQRGSTMQPLAPASRALAVQPIDLRNGDIVRTGADSSLALGFFEHSTITLGEKTALGVRQLSQQERYFDIYLYHHVGRLQVSVQPVAGETVEFMVETPALFVRVTGTRFVLFVAEDGKTEVTVQEGTVSITRKSVTTTLTTGELMVAAPGQPESMRTATPAPSATPTATATATETPSPTATATRRPTRTPRPTATAPTPTATVPALGGPPGALPTATLTSTPTGPGEPDATEIPPPPPTQPPPTQPPPTAPPPTAPPPPTATTPPTQPPPTAPPPPPTPTPTEEPPPYPRPNQ